MSTEMTVAIYRSGGMERRIHSGIYAASGNRNRKLRQDPEKHGADTQGIKKAATPAGTRNAASKNTLSIF